VSEVGLAVGPRVYGVAEVLQGLAALLEQRVGPLWVAGEIGDLRRPASGHLYFHLKDAEGTLRAVLFRGAARHLEFLPEEGLDVIAQGELTVYAPRGDLQLVVRHLEPRGAGALRLAFEQLRRRLEAEGLFAPGRKRRLPRVPGRIGVVASLESAALRDVLQVLGRRCPAIPVRVAPTRVQGAGAPEEIAAALELLGREGGVDVILVVRGGGSLEDLQAFNTELVARAIAAAPVPVATGVGHEIDVTIADLAADLRAPTPSAAAELAAPDREELGKVLRRDGRRLELAARAIVERAAAAVAAVREALALTSPQARLALQRGRLAASLRALPHLAAALVEGRSGRLGEIDRALARLAGAIVEAPRSRLAAVGAGLDALSPLAVLGRGYAFARRARDGAIVRRSDQVERGELLAVRVAEAEIDAVVTEARALRDQRGR
jgi:exodeoxyribonuclease VII large subunit